MDSEAWVRLALKLLGVSQKELALRLGVSQTQISKWKSGDHMSHDMERHFRDLTGIGDRFPSFVLAAGSIEESEKWQRLILALADNASESCETGYETAPLQDAPELLSWSVFCLFEQLGIAIPSHFPSELEVADGSLAGDDLDGAAENDFFEAVEANPHANFINRVFAALNDVYGFYAAFISEIVGDEDLDLFEVGAEIESDLITLAACKVDVDPQFAPRAAIVAYEARKNYSEWLGTVKERAFRAGIPLKAELLEMISQDHGVLGSEAEAHSFGCTESRLHPDIYMNELLCGMRAIHQVLPIIMKKLGVCQEFKLDTSDFYVSSPRRETEDS